jgi:hypothetical protein
VEEEKSPNPNASLDWWDWAGDADRLLAAGGDWRSEGENVANGSENWSCELVMPF